MRMELNKTSIRIVPEDNRDEVYLESVLGLLKKDDSCKAVRVAPIGLNYIWAYLQIERGI